jgi:hypothetical protein
MIGQAISLVVSRTQLNLTFISTGDNMSNTQVNNTQVIKDFVDRHSGNFTDDVIDMINERLTEVFNDEGISDYDIQADIADTLMKRIGENLQTNPEEWI